MNARGSRVGATRNDCGWTRDEMMTIAASRLLSNGCICFVGIGLPSAACNLARLTHAPDIVLIYESGTIGTRPEVLPLSIGDGELAATAACVIPLPEVFAWYLQAGRIDVGFLGAAQVDRLGNLNSTVIGSAAPTTRLPAPAARPSARTRRTCVMPRHAAQLRRTVDPHERAGDVLGRARCRDHRFRVLTPDPASELRLDSLSA